MKTSPPSHSWEGAGGRALSSLGWDPFFADAYNAAGFQDCFPARIIDERRGSFRAAASDGEWIAVTPGRLKRRASRGELPAVGDWIVLRPQQGERKGVIEKVLPRRSALSRRASGAKAEEQVLAANVDTLFLVAGLDMDFNPRRIERALAMAFESGASPVLLLNKADLVKDLAAKEAQAREAAGGVPVHVVSAKAHGGLKALKPYLTVGRTIALVGSSGVGKSTIVNRLLGREAMAVGTVRYSDDRGKHTTSHRELFIIEGGAILIDTPGLREIQLWEAEGGIAEAFDEIESLAPGCKFRDCRHDSEPGCAVRLAVKEGRIPAGRLSNYLKLKKEQKK